MESLQFVMLKGGQGRIWEKIDLWWAEQGLQIRNLCSFHGLQRVIFVFCTLLILVFASLKYPKNSSKMFSTWKNKWDYCKK